VEVFPDASDAQGKSSRHRGAVKGVRQYRLARDVSAEAPRVNRKGEAVRRVSKCLAVLSLRTAWRQPVRALRDDLDITDGLLATLDQVRADLVWLAELS